MIGISVLAVRYRAFVFAAPPYFVAGNRPAKYRGAVSVGALSPPVETPTKFLPSHEEWFVLRANREAAEE
jgi:hypothetical protein